MAGTVNKVILVGNLGKDPEIKYLESGVPVAKFSIATSEIYTDKNSGEKREITDWHNVVMWRGLAKIAEQYLKKGMKVYIEGKLKTRSWSDENQQMKYATEVIADEMVMLSKNEAAADQQVKPYPPTTENRELPPMNLGEDPADDLPF
ncbi:MAG: single-stranded DNA-binding protein [Crocinitomicaceae bacterium]|nr:single-stranded DNA-binding protein [Crocinitomicaceae bacterium]